MTTSNGTIVSGKKRSREDSKALVGTENGVFTEPPIKKQKISNNKAMDQENDTIEMDDEIKKEHNALILFSGSIPDHQLDSFCSQMINPNDFEQKTRSNIETTRDILECLFLEGTRSTIDIADLVEIGMFDEFVRAKSLTALVVSYDTDLAYQTLNILTKKYFLSNTHRVYITLNHMDYVHKYKILFGDGDNIKCYLNDCDSPKNEHILRDNELQNVLLDANERCCCVPIIRYSNPIHKTVYAQHIRTYGVNAMAKQCYQQAIERGCYYMNVSMRQEIMDTIWEYLGVVVHRKLDTYQIAHYECKHCLRSLYLKQNERKCAVQNAKGNKKKKSNSNLRKCELCNVDVPSSGNNWEQHVNGKKHKKKLKKQNQSNDSVS
eukprot:33197_1